MLPQKYNYDGLVILTLYFSILRPILIQHIPILSTLFKKHWRFCGGIGYPQRRLINRQKE